MRLEEVESRLGIVFPEMHRRALIDDTDPIREACPIFLSIADGDNCIISVNESLHEPEQWNTWPSYLVAFSCNGCGDYFAYDLRSRPYRVIYIDPLDTIAEALSDPDQLAFNSFAEWYAYELKEYRLRSETP